MGQHCHENGPMGQLLHTLMDALRLSSHKTINPRAEILWVSFGTERC